jgi:hypothetical protein
VDLLFRRQRLYRVKRVSEQVEGSIECDLLENIPQYVSEYVCENEMSHTLTSCERETAMDIASRHTILDAFRERNERAEEPTMMT